MNLLELMLAVYDGGFSCYSTDSEYADVVQMIGGGASVYFQCDPTASNTGTATNISQRDRIHIPKLSPRGLLVLGELLRRVSMPDAIYVLDNDVLLCDLEKSAENWAEAVVPIFRESPKRYVSAAGFGSGVICSVGNDTYFATCDHVVKEFERAEVVQANIGGRAFAVSKLRHKRDAVSDVAIASISDRDLAESGVEKVKRVPLDRDWLGWEGTGNFVAMGYPGAQNELKLKFNSTVRNCFAIFAKATSRKSSLTQLDRYFALEYSPRSVRRGDGRHFNPPDLDGMSGGPCFEIMKRWAMDRMSYSFRLAGLVCEFRRREPLILVSDVSTVLDCLSSKLDG
jgi:hypothetical protein